MAKTQFLPLTLILVFSLRVNAGGGSGGSGGSDKERNFATILVRKLVMLNLLKAGIKIHANFRFC